MGRLNNSPDPYLGLNEPDPYLAINEESASPPKPRTAEDSDSKPVGRNRAPLEDEPSKSAPKPKREKEEASVEPSLLRGLMTVLKGLGRKLDDAMDAKAKPPTVNVAAPKVDVAAPTVNVAAPKLPAPMVNVQTPPPRGFRVRCTERDEYGRGVEWEIKPLK